VNLVRAIRESLKSVRADKIKNFGLSVGLVFGLLNLVVLLLGDRHDPEKSVTAWQLLITDRAVTVLRVIATAITVGRVVGFVVFDNAPTFTAQIFVGFLAGAAVGAVRLLGSAWEIGSSLRVFGSR
jgi:hypothetical protein